MKKSRKALLAGLAGAMIPMTALAETADKDVWITPNTAVENASGLEIDINTNGKSTDGLLNLTYNPAVVSCGEGNVTFDEKVDKYSVNAAEAGVLKIAYLSEDAIEKGDFIHVSFSFVSEESKAEDAGLNLTGEVNDPSGTPLDAGIKEEGTTAPPAEEKPSEKPNKKPDNEAVGTGDVSSPAVYFTGMLAAVIAAGTAMLKKRRDNQ